MKNCPQITGKLQPATENFQKFRKFPKTSHKISYYYKNLGKNNNVLQTFDKFNI